MTYFKTNNKGVSPTVDVLFLVDAEQVSYIRQVVSSHEVLQCWVHLPVNASEQMLSLATSQRRRLTAAATAKGKRKSHIRRSTVGLGTYPSLHAVITQLILIINPEVGWHYFLPAAISSRDAPIIDIGWLVRWYRSIVVYTIGKYKFFIFITKSKQTWEWLAFLEKVGAFCTFAFWCIFVLSALCSPSSKWEFSDNNWSLTQQNNLVLIGIGQLLHADNRPVPILRISSFLTTGLDFP